jgi:acylaminoacyl-peptidase
MSSRPLIPRRTLFDNPTFFGAKISPDGRWLSWLAPFDGVLNVWIAPSSDVKAGQPLTRTQGRPINWHDWSPDARFVLFLNDENGDENHHLYAVDPLSATLRDLTPFDKVRAQPAFYSHVVRDAITVGINNRDERWHDLYRIDVATGQRTLIWENRQDFGYIGTDWQLQPRYGRICIAATAIHAPRPAARYWPNARRCIELIALKSPC